MELGQALFSNGDIYQCEMQAMVQNGLEILAELIEMKRGDSGTLTSNSGGDIFENEVFSMQAYCWCDGEDVGHDDGCPPNFLHHQTGFSCAWYKHVGRGNTQTVELGGMAWKAILIDCLASL